MRYPLTRSFSCGSIAGMPLCCQQRRGACTRLEQGVPFLVRAPHKYTSSSIDVAGAESPVEPWRDCTALVELEFRCTGESLSGESLLLTIVSGGGAGRRLRPATYPEASNARPASKGMVRRDLRSFRAQASQNFRLVQMRQRSRRIFVPHWAQKFGLYKMRTPLNEGQVTEGNTVRPQTPAVLTKKATQMMPRASENS